MFGYVTGGGSCWSWSAWQKCFSILKGFGWWFSFRRTLNIKTWFGIWGARQLDGLEYRLLVFWNFPFGQYSWYLWLLGIPQKLQSCQAVPPMKSSTSAPSSSPMESGPPRFCAAGGEWSIKPLRVCYKLLGFTSVSSKHFATTSSYPFGSKQLVMCKPRIEVKFKRKCATCHIHIISPGSKPNGALVISKTRMTYWRYEIWIPCMICVISIARWHDTVTFLHPKAWLRMTMMMISLWICLLILARKRVGWELLGLQLVNHLSYLAMLQSVWNRLDDKC